jgi:hypothetical protein
MNIHLNRGTSSVVTALHTDLDPAVIEFDHPEWNKVLPIHINRKWSGEEAPDSRHAEASILWSEESLLVRFVCRQFEPLIVNPSPQLDGKTIGLWDRDVCEIFIAPDPEKPNRYFELEAAPTGEWLDLAIQLKPDGRETDWQFNSGMTTAARIAAEQLTITIGIPWSESIPRPHRGDRWRINLFRCIGEGDERYLAWQPTYTAIPSFHVPKVFGWLRFI